MQTLIVSIRINQSEIIHAAVEKASDSIGLPLCNTPAHGRVKRVGGGSAVTCTRCNKVIKFMQRHAKGEIIL